MLRRSSSVASLLKSLSLATVAGAVLRSGAELVLGKDALWLCPLFALRQRSYPAKRL